MRRYFLVLFIVLLGLLVAQPAISLPTTGGRSGGGYHPPGGGHTPGGGYHPPGGGYHPPGGGYYHHGWRGHYGGYPYYRGYGYYGGYPSYYGGYGFWYGSPAYYGPWFFTPWYVSIELPIYYTPPPVVYAVPDPQHPYAYPDPAFVERYGRMDSAQPSGEWVIVPGQYVNGVWVNEHKVWVAGSQ